jgi:hypothetical protein
MPDSHRYPWQVSLISRRQQAIASEGFKVFPTVILKPWDAGVFSSIGTKLDLTIILVLLPESFIVLSITFILLPSLFQ